MAAIISKEDILKTVQAMSKDERLKLIEEIAALPESVKENSSSFQSDNLLSDEEVMSLTNKFINKHRNLLRRLAE